MEASYCNSDDIFQVQAEAEDICRRSIPRRSADRTMAKRSGK